MKGGLIREDERNVRVEVLMVADAADFAGNAVATAKIAELAAANQAVAVEKQNQIGGAGEMREDYDIYEDAFEEMIDDMETIRDFAHSMGQNTPGLDDKFRIPRSGGKGAKIAAAYVFADDAEEIKQRFLDMGIDKDFITDLRAKADAAQEALNDAEASTGAKVGATSALAANVKTASDTVEALRPIVRYVYRNNPAKFGAWDYASRVERHTAKPRVPPTA